MSTPTTSAAPGNLETLLIDDPEGIERDKLLQVLQDFEQELNARLKQGCPQDEYKQVSVVLNGARVAQAVLADYHQKLNH